MFWVYALVWGSCKEIRHSVGMAFVCFNIVFFVLRTGWRRWVVVVFCFLYKI